LTYTLLQGVTISSSTGCLLNVGSTPSGLDETLTEFVEAIEKQIFFQAPNRHLTGILENDTVFSETKYNVNPVYCNTKYTVSQVKRYRFYFYDNFDKFGQILIVLSPLNSNVNYRKS